MSLIAERGKGMTGSEKEKPRIRVNYKKRELKNQNQTVRNLHWERGQLGSTDGWNYKEEA